MKAYTVYEIDTRNWKLNTRDMLFFTNIEDALAEFNNRKNQYLNDKTWRIGNDCRCIDDIKTSDKSIYFWKRATPQFPRNYAIYINIDTIEIQ